MDTSNFFGGRCDARGAFKVHADYKTGGYQGVAKGEPGFLNVRIVNERGMNWEVRTTTGADGKPYFVSLTFNGDEEMEAALFLFRSISDGIERVLGERQ